MESTVMNSTEDLNRLSQEVLEYYEITPETTTVIQGGSIKTVWKVLTPKGTVCLKRLKQPCEKALFSVNAQIFIKNAGGRVPGIFLSKAGQPIVQYNNQLFVLYEWVEGRSLDFLTAGDLIPSLQGLAAFHLASRGYVPPEGAQNSTKQAKWPEEYTAMRSNLKEWKEISQNTSARPDHSAYSNHAEAMIELADLALCLLENSPYFKLTAPGSDSIVLCHQDYGKGNALLTDDGVYVLDLDGVTYDLPVRDLRKIIGKRAEKRGRWAEADIEEVLQAYTAVNPLSAEIREILRIDLIFPHWFFGLTKNLFLKNKFLKPYEIDRIVKLEQAKLALLNVSG